jgi:hypothetical protein
MMRHATVMGLLSTLVGSAWGHASVIMPPSRNAVDGAEPGTPWSGGQHPATGWLMPYGADCTNGTDACNSGQSAFWFSQGCTIGCKVCRCAARHNLAHPTPPHRGVHLCEVVRFTGLCSTSHTTSHHLTPVHLTGVHRERLAHPERRSLPLPAEATAAPDAGAPLPHHQLAHQTRLPRGLLEV